MTGKGKQYFRNFDKFHNSKYITHEGSIVENCLDGEGILYYGKSNQVYQRGIWKNNKYVKPISNIKISEQVSVSAECSKQIQHNLQKWDEMLKDQKEFPDGFIKEGQCQYSFYQQSFQQLQGSKKDYDQYYIEMPDIFRKELQNIQSNSSILWLISNFKESQQQNYQKQIIDIERILKSDNYEEYLIDQEKNENLVQLFTIINSQIQTFQECLKIKPKKIYIQQKSCNESQSPLKLKQIEYFRKNYGNQLEQLEIKFEEIQNKEREKLIDIQDKCDKLYRELFELSQQYNEENLKYLHQSIEQNNIRQTLQNNDNINQNQLESDSHTKAMEEIQKNYKIIQHLTKQLQDYIIKTKELSDNDNDQTCVNNKNEIKESIQEPQQSYIHQQDNNNFQQNVNKQIQQNPIQIQINCKSHNQENITEISDDDKEIVLFCQKCLKLKNKQLKTIKIKDFIQKYSVIKEQLEKEYANYSQTFVNLIKTCIDQINKFKNFCLTSISQSQQNALLFRGFDELSNSQNLSYDGFIQAISNIKSQNKIDQMVTYQLNDRIKKLQDMIELIDAKLDIKKEPKMKILNEQTDNEIYQQYWCKYDQVLQYKEIDRINNKHWLTSSIIDAYINKLNIINEELFWQKSQANTSHKRCLILPSFIFTSYFSNPEYKTKIQEYLMEYESINYQIYNIYEIICLIVNISKQHWVLARLDFENSTIFIYDSQDYSTQYQYILQKVNQFLKALNYQNQFKIKKQTGTPKQYNNYDCGVFTCIYAQQISEGHMNSEYLQPDEMRQRLNETIKFEGIN